MFAPLGPTYDRYAALLSFGQDARWRRYLVSRTHAGPADTVLDVATGTGAVAAELIRQTGCKVVGLDQSAEMLAEARRRLPAAVELVEGEADRLPFPDASFAALTFTYLMRYVDDPGATLRELARVVRPGGTIAGLEFGVPPNPAVRALWRLYVGHRPAARRPADLAGLAGRRRLPRPEHRAALGADPARSAARPVALGGDRGRLVPAPQPRRRDRHLGPPDVSAEARPAFYALSPGSWRDYVTLLHPPYTAWHLSYVAIGAALAPHWYPGRLGAALAAFFLAVGIGAHALDELNGRPLATQIPSTVLAVLAALSIAAAVAIGIAGAVLVDLWLLAVRRRRRHSSSCAYNLELFGGRFHSDVWFAIDWGAFPLLTAYFACAGRFRVEALLGRAFAALSSYGQRRLSSPVRRLRREVASVSGSIELDDGSREPITRGTLIAGNEAALRAFAFGIVALAVALVVLRAR